MSEQDIKSFSENQGLPANAHAKKKAKEKSARAKLAKEEVVFFTSKGDKILQVKAKSNGSYSSYVGSVKKHKAQFESLKAGWVKDGSWIEPHELESKVSAAVERLQKGA